VTLGIYPAAGGTWRLPRLVGLGRAKELVFTGRIVEAEEGQPLGPVRAAGRRRCAECGVRAGGVIAKNAPLALQVAKVSLNTLARGESTASIERLGQALLFRFARETDPDDGLSREANQALTVRPGSPRREEPIRKSSRRRSLLPSARGAHRHDHITHVGVLGAGTMGHGSAHVCATAGLQVILYDVTLPMAQAGWRRSQEPRDRGREEEGHRRRSRRRR